MANDLDYAICHGAQHAAERVFIDCGRPATTVVVRIECGAEGRGLLIEVCDDCARKAVLWPPLTST